VICIENMSTTKNRSQSHLFETFQAAPSVSGTNVDVPGARSSHSNGRRAHSRVIGEDASPSRPLELRHGRFGEASPPVCGRLVNVITPWVDLWSALGGRWNRRKTTCDPKRGPRE
jgi:hypothetical protein